RPPSTRARGKGTTLPVYQAKVPYGSEDRRPWMTLPFPQAEYDRRIAAVRGRMQAEDLAALVAFSSNADPGHARYLANFEAGAGETFVVIPLDRGPMLTTNWLMHGEPMHTSIWTTWLEDVRPAERPGFARPPARGGDRHDCPRRQRARRRRPGPRGGVCRRRRRARVFERGGGRGARGAETLRAVRPAVSSGRYGVPRHGRRLLGILRRCIEEPRRRPAQRRAADLPRHRAGHV